MKLGFIGLGVMGAPMAGHLARAGHEVTVYNRTRSKAEAWVTRHGGRAAATPRDAAAGAAIVFSCVGNDDDLCEVTSSSAGAFHGMSEGAIFVDGFAVDLMRKDLRIAMEEARANGAQLPGTALIDQFYAKLQKQGHGRLDTSSLIKLVSDH